MFETSGGDGQLKDVSHLSEVSTDGYTVVWPDGQDLCPDELYALSEEKLYLIADETTAPYEDGNNPFVRTEKDEEFDLKVAEKFGLVMENA